MDPKVDDQSPDALESERAEGKEGTEARAPKAPASPQGTTSPWTRLRVTHPSFAIALAALASALVNAFFIFRLKPHPDVPRALHLAYDAGYLFALGLPIALLAALVPSRARGALSGLAMIGLFYVHIGTDLGGISADIGGDQANIVLAILSGLGSLGPTIAWAVGARARRRRWTGALAIALSIALLVVSNLLLHGDYRGIHLYITLVAGALLSAAILSPPTAPATRSRALRWASVAPPLALALFAVAVPPKQMVRQELTKIDGQVVLPLLALAGWGEVRSDVAIPPEWQPWFRNRRQDPDIAPNPPIAEAPIVALITLDSFRYDLLEDKKDRTQIPRMLEIREKSVDFTQARAPAARTATTWGAVYAGKYFSGLHWAGGNRPTLKGDQTPRIFEVLGERGIESVAFTAYSLLGTKDLGRGASEVHQVPPAEKQDFAVSTQVMPELIERITQQGPEPLLITTHLMDAHYPYDSAVRRGSTRARYLAELKQADAQIGALWDALSDRGLLDRTVLIISADHGEGLGQHDTRYHTTNLYEELIHVPLFVYAKGLKPHRVDEPVSLLDLGPTLYDLFQVPTPGRSFGQTLVPFLKGESPKLTRPIAAERPGTQVLFVKGYKVIIDKDHGRNEIYDLSKDPTELVNLYDSLGAEGAELVAITRKFFQVQANNRW